MNDSVAVAFYGSLGGALGGGAITLIGLLFIEWFKSYLDRPLLKATGLVGRIPLPGHEGPQLLLETSNPHSKPVTIISFGLGFSREQPFGLPRENLGDFPFAPRFDLGYKLPHQIDSGTSFGQWISVDYLCDFMKEEGLKPTELNWVWFKSATGNVFRNRIDKMTVRKIDEAFKKRQSTPSLK